MRLTWTAMLVALAALAIIGCGTRRTTIHPPVTVIAVSRPSPSPSPTPRRVRIPKVGTAPFHVCAFAFNSPDELAAIQSELSPDDFDFIDLTPTEEGGNATPPGFSTAPRYLSKSTPGWLIDSCQPDLRCDIVVYAGEFAGGFFGKYGISLSVQEMEEASCLSRCRGLFHDPREVFLLACNTLATKSADERTPEEYLRVLRSHGFSQADAERVVDLRYGPLGPSFRESLRRIFMGVPRVYGFSSVAPRGEASTPLLHQYFQRKGDYAKYLTRSGRDTSPNKELLGLFANTSLVQTTGVTAVETVAADRALVCKLYDDTQTVSSRLRIIHHMFTRSDFLAFVPTVEVFLNRHPPDRLTADERRLFRDIQLLEAPRQQMVELMYRLKVSALKMQMAHLALQLAWINADEFRRLAVEGAQELLAEPLSSEVADIGCELVKYAPVGAGIRSEEIPERFLWHPEGYRLLDCLSPTDAQVTLRLLAGLDNIDELTRLWAAYALSRRRLDDSVLTTLARRLDDPCEGVRDRVRWTFQAQGPLSPSVLAAVRQYDSTLANTLRAREVR